MPYNRDKLAGMNADDPDEYVTKEQIAKRLGICVRNVQRLAEQYGPKLKNDRRSTLINGKRKVTYRWAAILERAKIHKGLLEEPVPSRAIKRANTKRRAEERTLKDKLVQWIQGDLFPASGDVRGSALWTREHQPKKYRKMERVLGAFGIDLEDTLNRRLNGLPFSLPPPTQEDE